MLESFGNNFGLGAVCIGVGWLLQAIAPNNKSNANKYFMLKKYSFSPRQPKCLL
jgi:hypothetical protein